MLRSTSFESNEAALLALLNLSVKDEGMRYHGVFRLCYQHVHIVHTALIPCLSLIVSLALLCFALLALLVIMLCLEPRVSRKQPLYLPRNKKSIIDAGALEPIIGFLQSNNPTLQEHASASLLTLSASSITKPILTSFVVIPLLVNILRRGTPQAKIDAIMTLYNLSTSQESLMCYEESRKELTCEEGGILAIVEVLEIGSLQSREHAVGALLTMLQSDRCKYQELILREGVIPSLKKNHKRF
ncbi:hypothetical protein RND71_040191 [Anisodus tanguticus]|uniref:Uncharacterized protein n=1 Tax=Anisodus tanguticus TaxID=243964 RepID=A0AAE1QXX5_9SOLA|nr:hypothetical protein RND71_040191 [Anisodus tanguticus]